MECHYPPSMERINEEADFFIKKNSNMSQIFSLYKAILAAQTAYLQKINISIPLTEEQLKDSLRKKQYVLSGRKPDLDASLFKEVLISVCKAIKEVSPEAPDSVLKLYEANEFNMEKIDGFLKNIALFSQEELTGFIEKNEMDKRTGLPAAQTEFTGSYENPPDLLPECWSRVRFNEYAEGDTIKWYFSFISCMHCSDPACLSICPANAISQTELKTIRIDPKICLGCGLCKNSCPFNVPRIGQITDKPLSWKCTSCFDRINNGYTTACSKACPTGALSFGDLDEKIAEAEAKVAVLQEKGYANARIYGKDEMGGLGVIYVLADSPEKYGLPENPQLSLGSYIWNIALRPVKFLATVGITVGVINNMINNKAIKAEKKEEQEIN